MTTSSDFMCHDTYELNQPYNPIRCIYRCCYSYEQSIIQREKSENNKSIHPTIRYIQQGSTSNPALEGQDKLLFSPSGIGSCTQVRHRIQPIGGRSRPWNVGEKRTIRQLSFGRETARILLSKSQRTLEDKIKRILCNCNVFPYYLSRPGAHK